ncbi:capsular polysaccharide biosynthesis protein [Variovorax sp. YR752]|uniref:capsular polysaccharide biosynthesis protein n=1 Tax=Variovorax sp. YR752 TaxID=1884383 RepID=UPI0031377F1D
MNKLQPTPADPGAGAYVVRHAGVMLVRNLPRLLGAPLLYRPRGSPPRDARGLLGWGLKGKHRDTAALARELGLPYLAVEDGFLRSVALGDTDEPLSLVFDDLGVYYDARSPSRLEQFIAAVHTDEQRARARRIAQAWCAQRVSKYNHGREAWTHDDRPFVLAVDQTFGDMSIELGLASPASFARMLEAALDEHPGLSVVLKVHPDVLAGRKRAHFAELPPGAAARVRLLAENVHPPALLEAAQAVYVVTSQMGFEALMWGKPVRSFGMPFYAGWGLTRDELPRPDRRQAALPVVLDDLVHAALAEYPRYIDPETLQRCEPERVIEWMGLQRRMRCRFPAKVQAIAFSDWKQPIARAFFGGSQLAFVEKPAPLATGDGRAVWGRAADDDPSRRGTASPLLQVEDGFLRSVGLGAHWVRPLSWVIDRRGMYYDATSPSDLEEMLETACFDAPTLARARALRESIVASGVTKYNVGAGGWNRPAGRRLVVLVPGQVEGDASIRWGSPALQRNLDLLRAVRLLRPEAWIVYKPHPDVLARKRPGGNDIAAAREWCDQIVTDVPITALFPQVDELHTLTSLAGFEALLRGRAVVCHGSPFYAGWGLTTDLLAHVRRTRQLTIDELVAGALIKYPTYVSRTTGTFTTPERALYELSHWRETEPPREPWSSRALRRLKRWRARLRRP